MKVRHGILWTSITAIVCLNQLPAAASILAVGDEVRCETKQGKQIRGRIVLLTDSTYSIELKQGGFLSSSGSTSTITLAGSELQSLLPDTCCYFRLRASNVGGATYGDADSFMTLSVNMPPMTWLTAAPPETTVTGYTIHLYWSGFDYDGEVGHYEWQRIDEGISSPWFSTTKQDSIFVVDLSFTIDWQLLVRAVDTQGAADPTPPSYVFPR